MTTPRPKPKQRPLKRVTLSLALAATLIGCQPPKTYTLHDLAMIDQHQRGSLSRLGTPDTGPDWYYAGTEDGQHVILLKKVDTPDEREFRVPQGGFRIDQTTPYTKDRNHWRKINHRIRARVD